VWRLADAGWAVRYEPRAVATHEPRETWRAWVHQRVAYGSSAAPLAHRHPGALAPVRLGRWGAAAWAGAMINPALGAGVAGAGIVPLARKLRPHDGATPWRTAARLTAVGNLHAAHQLADATTSVWLPAAAIGATVSTRARWALAAATAVPAIAEWARRRPRLDPARYAALRALDRAAYGFGVWRGVVAERELGPLMPAIEPAGGGTSPARRQ
jgi:hypothetical protein